MKLAAPFFFVQLLFILATNTSFGYQQSKLEAVATKNEITIAEPFIVSLTVTAETGAKVEFIDSRPEGFELLSVTDLPEIPDSEVTGLRNWTRKIELETFRPGKKTLGPFRATIALGSKSETVQSRTLSIEVNSTVPQEQEPSDFRPVTDVVDAPIMEPPGDRWPWWWLGGGLFAAALAGGWYWNSHNRDQRLRSSTWLKQRIENLRIQNQNAPETEDWQSAFTEELTLILADHLKFHCNAELAKFDLTTDLEHVDEAQPAVVKSKSQLVRLLNALQQTKFAGTPSNSAQRDSWCQTAQEFIQATLEHRKPEERDK